MRQGADHVKIMMSGGVASPYDPLDSLQFSDGEVSAAVEEATAFGRYVCAHAYSAESITRAARLGVRTIEHGNLIDDASAKLMAEKGMFLVANLVTYYAMKDRAKQFGMIGESLAKNEIVLQGGLKSLEICKRHGIPVAYGSDLLGELHWDQSKEFTIRQEVVSPIEIIRSATTIGADVLRMPGKVGTLQAGAFSDVILVDGNPLKDLALLGDQGKHLSLIMKAGILHKNRSELNEPAEFIAVQLIERRSWSGDLDRRTPMDLITRCRPHGARNGGWRVACIYPAADVLRDLAGVLRPGDPVIPSGRLLAEMVSRRSRQRQVRQRDFSSACRSP